MPGRPCSVCVHDEAHPINVALVQGESNRSIARSYGFSENAVRRHRRQHLPELLVKARDAVEAADAGDLLKELEDIRSHLRSLVGLAARDGKYSAAIAGEGVLLKRVELLAKLRQLLDERPQVNILIAPQVQQVIVEALRPYPEAGYAVADALDSVKERGEAG
jgi:hypothetical protein